MLNYLLFVAKSYNYGEPVRNTHYARENLLAGHGKLVTLALSNIGAMLWSLGHRPEGTGKQTLGRLNNSREGWGWVVEGAGADIFVLLQEIAAPSPPAPMSLTPALSHLNKFMKVF